MLNFDVFASLVKYNENPEFAKELFEGGVDEKEQCGDEELVARIEWMKEYIFNSYNQEETHSTN